jgi:hypothetical protein
VSIFRSAILDSDGHTVNVGYLSLFWIMVVVLNVIPIMCVFAGWGIYQGASVMDMIKALGLGVAAVAGGFSTTLGALGLFLMGDAKAASAGQTAPQSARTSASLPDDSTSP